MNGFTLFTGFDGAGIGMTQAGITILGGIEYDDTIAQVARDNGHPVTTADILDVDPYQYMHANIQALHASPPCPNFSVAKAGAEETPHDIALAQAVCDWIEVIRPQIFTLENVQAYRKSKSWQMIEQMLTRCGYWLDAQVVNSADYGVPQTRVRFIVRALLGRMVPHLPAPVRWVGWYEAIEDLIPTLPKSKFAPWQLARLPEEIKTFITDTMNTTRDATTRSKDEPVMTIQAAHGWRPSQLPRASLMAGSGNTNFEDAEPGKGIREEAEPAHVLSSGGGSRIPRAFLVNGALSTTATGKTLQINDNEQPSGTIVSSWSNVKDTRVFLVNSAFPGSNGKKHFEKDEPSYTVDTQAISRTRAWLSHGRVVKMTPRALARFQSFPDDYKLPDKIALACKGIGNAVPPLLMRRIYEGLLEATE